MQHPLDQAPDQLCATLLAHSGELPQLAAACEEANRVWDGDIRSPRGPRAALILAQLKADQDTLTATCLADPRLTPILDEWTVTERYGAQVALLLGDVRRLVQLSENQTLQTDRAQVENHRRLLLALVRDVRSILIKLALRLERLRALPWLEDAAKRRHIAQETLDLYAPLAHRLGLGQLKWELEDLAFRHLEPETYKQIARWLDERRVEREAYIARVRAQLENALHEAGLVARVYGRPKHIYSIFGKMQRKRLSFEQLFDVRALRVEVESIADCYAALGVVHTLWDPIPGEYDDYIAHPKSNGYQSLHTAVRALEGKTVEVQIRTKAMHEQAELGIAAHWRYKEGGKGAPDPFQAEMERLRLALEEGESTALAAHTIYVFTPKGEVIELPRGATPLDLAYSIHTELGHSCRGAKVNGRLVPLHTPLNNADRVELLRAAKGGPSREWADPKAGYLVSKSARAKVRAWFRQRERESTRAEGQQHWERTIRRLGLTREAKERLLLRLHLKSEEAAWEALGEGRLTRAALLDAARAVLGNSHTLDEGDAATRHTRTFEPDQQRFTLEGLQAEPARCCNPAPGDAVAGFITRGQGLRLHRADCRNLAHLRNLHPERIIEISWPTLTGVPVRVNLEVFGEDRPELLRDVGHVLAQFKARVVQSEGRLERRTGQNRLRLILELTRLEELAPMIAKLRALRSVDEVNRI